MKLDISIEVGSAHRRGLRSCIHRHVKLISIADRIASIKFESPNSTSHGAAGKTKGRLGVGLAVSSSNEEGHRTMALHLRDVSKYGDAA